LRHKSFSQSLAPVLITKTTAKDQTSNMKYLNNNNKLPRHTQRIILTNKRFRYTQSLTINNRTSNRV